MPGDSTTNPDDGHQHHRISTKPVNYNGRISWEVEDCLATILAQKVMDSPPVTYKFGQSEFKFQLRLRLDSKEENIAVYLHSFDKSKLNTELDFKAFSGSGKVLSTKRDVKIFEPEAPSWGFASFLSKNVFDQSPAKPKVPLGGSVKFVCDFTITNLTVSVVEEVSGPVLGTGVDIIRANSKLLSTGLVSDFTITCKDEHFKCHKAILAARSKYFESMFRIDMAESSQSSTVLNDISAKAFTLLLEFIYTGSLSDSSDLKSTELLTLADRFLFDDLKLACEVAISKTVGMSNAVELLSISHNYSAKQLQKAAAKFVMENRLELSKTEEWKEMVKTNPGAMGALFSE